MLHLLVLDEFDWGACRGSLLNEYLQKVISTLNEATKIGKKIQLLFLPVSATPEMLLAADEDYEAFTVSFSELGKDNPPFFAMQVPICLQFLPLGDMSLSLSLLVLQIHL